MNVFLAAVVVTVVAYAFSWVWFGPFMFKGLYEQGLVKSNRAKPYPRPMIFGLFFALTYVAMLTVGSVGYRLGGGSLMTGARVGLYAWLVYVGIDFSNALFNRLNIVVNVINWGYWILVCTVGGGLFAALSQVQWP